MLDRWLRDCSLPDKFVIENAFCYIVKIVVFSDLILHRIAIYDSCKMYDKFFWMFEKEGKGENLEI